MRSAPGFSIVRRDRFGLGFWIVGALALFVACAGAIDTTQASQTLVGFQINSVDTAPLFTFRNQGTANILDDALSASAHVDLSVERNGVEMQFPNASFALSALLTGLESGSLMGTTVYQLIFDGSFTFAEAGSGDGIFDVAFTGARLLMLEFNDSGVVNFASGLGANSSVNYVPGPALPPGLVATGNQEFHFTVNGLQGLLGGQVQISAVPPPNHFQFEDFGFNSSFAGSTNLIPEPASWLLGALGGCVLIAWRRARNRVTA
jgi:hypothetical protein